MERERNQILSMISPCDSLLPRVLEDNVWGFRLLKLIEGNGIFLPTFMNLSPSVSVSETCAHSPAVVNQSRSNSHRICISVHSQIMHQVATVPEIVHLGFRY